MRILLSKYLLLVLIFTVGSAFGDIEYGHCKLVGNIYDPTIIGEIHIISDGDSVTVHADISGITQNLGVDHGMHIHQFGDILSNTSANVGAHFMGLGNGTHGCPNSEVHDTGDMGNWPVNENGTLYFEKTLNLTYLTGGLSIIGRSIVLHNLTDNCESAAASGTKIAQCVIGVGNPTTLDPEYATASNLAVNGAGADIGTLAVCALTGTAGNEGISGVAVFEQQGSNVLITAKIAGLYYGTIHGFHIHQYGDLTADDGTSAGSHYNPLNSPHGLPPNTSIQVGDLGNICTYDSYVYDHEAYYQVSLPLPSVNGDEYNIIGRGLIIHSMRDDGGTNFGSRIAQCVIGIGNGVTTQAPAVPNGCCSDPVCLDADEISSSSTSSTSAVSTTGDVPATSGGPNNNATLTVIGGVILGVVILGVTFLLFFFYFRLRKIQKDQDRYKPFLDDTDQ